MPRFLEVLAETRRRGYATDCEEHVANSCCVATTIFNQGRAVGAAAGRERHLPAQQADALVATLRAG